MGEPNADCMLADVFLHLKLRQLDQQYVRMICPYFQTLHRDHILAGVLPKWRMKARHPTALRALTADPPVSGKDVIYGLTGALQVLPEQPQGSPLP